MLRLVQIGLAREAAGFHLVTTVYGSGRVPHVPPDFLLRLVALTNFMRLSLQKAAHVAVRWCSVQEIRFAPAYLGG